MVTSCASCLPASSMLIVVMERLWCVPFASWRVMRTNRISCFARGRKLLDGDKCMAESVYNSGPRMNEKSGHGVPCPYEELRKMGKSRREFLGTASAGLLAALTAADVLPAEVVEAAEQDPTKEGPAGAPSA